MSATKRGKSKDPELDRKYTDERVARFLVDSLSPEVFRGTILEPSVGRGAFVRAVRATRGVQRMDLIFGVDIDAEVSGLSEADLGKVGDFLDPHLFDEWMETPPSLIIGNPPFSQAEDHIRRAMEVVRQFGTVAFILRLDFLGSKCRREFWKEYPAVRYDVIRPRPSFTGGRTDSCQYAFFQWVKDAPVFETISGFADWRK